MQRAMRVLQLARAAFRERPERLPSPLPGSVLHQERRHTAREPLDTMVVGHRVRSTDNIGQLFSIMIDDEENRVLAYAYSGYSLIRTAVESAAVALWLIQPSRKPIRVFRALQLSYRNATETLALMETMGDVEIIQLQRERAQRVIARLEELKDTVGELKQKELGHPPKYTEILKSVSDRRPGTDRRYSFSSPFVIWKISSAFIHGSDTVTRALSDVRQVEQFDDGVASFEVTPSLQLLASAASVCVDLLAKLDDRYLELATHDHAGRPVNT